MVRIGFPEAPYLAVAVLAPLLYVTLPTNTLRLTWTEPGLAPEMAPMSQVTGRHTVLAAHSL